MQKQLVLFSGTTCQIAGLKAYLGNCSQDNLITMDVLCHGVASKQIVQAFIKSKEKQFGKEVSKFLFRVNDENRGWYNGGGTRMHLFFGDGTSVIEPGRYDTFFLGFNNNFFLRESCYRCKFIGVERISDFTLADYWGCNNPEVSPEQLKLGVSLILVNTEKAKDILSRLQKDVKYYLIDGTRAIAYNRALSTPQKRPAIRNVFFDEIQKYGYDKVVKRQFRMLFFKRQIKKNLYVICPRKIVSKYIHEI